MARSVENRPFNGFKSGINNSDYFFGRQQLINEICRSPFQVRILVGGRRLGKTSTLFALRHAVSRKRKPNRPLLNPDYRRVLMILIRLNLSVPKNLDNFFYILISSLRATTPLLELPWYRRWWSSIPETRVNLGFFQSKFGGKPTIGEIDPESFRKELRQAIQNLQPSYEGICFLIDEAEFVVKKDWSNEAWGFFRGWFEEDDAAINSSLGLVISGYRSVNDYRGNIGSPLHNISTTYWLTPLDESDTRELITFRAAEEDLTLSSEEISGILIWGGCHPYLTQQLINQIADLTQEGSRPPIHEIAMGLGQLEKKNFQDWWKGLREEERSVYLALTEVSTVVQLQDRTQLTENAIQDALEILEGTGLIQRLDRDLYRQGARLFSEWVSQG